MTATKDFYTPPVMGDIQEYTLAAATTIYAGSFVGLDTTAGTVTACTDAANTICVGIAIKQASTTAGDTVVQVVTEGTFLMKGASLSATDVGSMAYVYQDDTVKVSGVTYSVQVGIIVKYISATSCWVRMKLPNLAAQTAASVSIADSGSLITGTNVETALQEIQGNLGGSTSRVLKVYEFWYDFATHGGAQGAIAMTKRGGAVAQTLPDNFVITDIVYEMELAFTSGGSATVKLGSTGSDAHIVAQQAFDHAQFAINVAQKAVSLKKIDTADSLLVTVGTADLTAGRVNVYVLGFQGA